MPEDATSAYLAPAEFAADVAGVVAESQKGRHACRRLVLKTMGAAKVAAWCGVQENTVYQWLSRASEAEPFPTVHVLSVLLGASREGIRFDVSILWPPFHEVRL